MGFGDRLRPQVVCSPRRSLPGEFPSKRRGVREPGGGGDASPRAAAQGSCSGRGEGARDVWTSCPCKYPLRACRWFGSGEEGRGSSVGLTQRLPLGRIGQHCAPTLAMVAVAALLTSSERPEVGNRCGSSSLRRSLLLVGLAPASSPGHHGRDREPSPRRATGARHALRDPYPWQGGRRPLHIRPNAR